VFLSWPLCLLAQIDLTQAHRERLDNGLTLIVLEEHSFASASVQMLYRAGARDEQYGTTGVAHFLEHMAFRATEHFPDTEVVNRIYAAGGEWHGYTWIDQTTYYATVPSDQLDLLLRIEADRMDRLLLEPRWVEPERGAVLAEMHGYENDPASVLHDALVFTALQAHPYRNNTIGWESDIQAMQHADLVNFYRAHYRPSNAVLVVVGDVEREAVRNRVMESFGALRALPPTPLPRTVEPRQRGERRIMLQGAGSSSHFEIAYQAPGVNDVDFPAFLLLQELLSGSTGVNFQQVFGTSPGRPDAFLSGIAEDMRSWYPPAAQTYIFSIAGSAAATALPDDIERKVETAVARLRDTPVSPEVLSLTRQRLQEALVFDVETHEDAAHQMAYFEGLNAWNVLHRLPALVTAIDADELQQVARRWLQPQQRTIGWYRAGERPAMADSEVPARAVAFEPDEQTTLDSMNPAAVQSDGAAAHTGSARYGAGSTDGVPAVHHLPGGVVLILQHNPSSPGVYLRLALNGDRFEGDAALQAHQPVWGVSNLTARALSADLETALERLRRSFESLQLARYSADSAAEDPREILQAAYSSVLGLSARKLPAAPGARFLTVVGGFDKAELVRLATRYFGDLPVATPPAQSPLAPARDDLRWPLSGAKAQAQIGYVVPAPLPASDEFMAWRALLYIISHDYAGRLGEAAISRRGLAYFIDSQYRSDGQQAWVSITTGVDPRKLEDLEALYREQLVLLHTSPPTADEVAGAKSHFAGRLASANQSNEEISAALATQWLWFGQMDAPQQMLARIDALTQAQVLAAVATFTSGKLVIVGE